MGPTSRQGSSGDESWTEEFFGHDPDASAEECPHACPVCMGLSLVKHMRPEVAGHLMAAGREFILAAKAFIDSFPEPASPNPESKLEKIEVTGFTQHPTE